MKKISKSHLMSKAQVKKMIDEYVADNGLSVSWKEYCFSASAYGTKVTGKIADSNVVVEIKGWFEESAYSQIKKVIDSL